MCRRADVSIRNTDTNDRAQTQSNDAGVYVAPFLQPGHYEVQAAKTGFAAVLRKDLTLQVGQTLTINFSLAVQTTQEVVRSPARRRWWIPRRPRTRRWSATSAVSNLPIAGRRWDNFVLLTPNVTTDGTSGLVSYRGISGLYNSNTVDGANNNQAFFSEARGRANSGAYVYSMDSIQEYQVSASNYSAELGQAAGGVVNAVTKSGANDFHGDLFYYLRYPTWNALDPYPKSQGIYSQPIHQWQQFGGSVGGPIVKDKLFYFGTYDGSRKVNPITYTSSIYSASVQRACLPGAVDRDAVRQRQRFPVGQQGTFPRATNQDVGFGKLDYQANAAQPCERLVRFHELPRAQCLQHRAHVQQQLAEHQRQLPLPRAHLRGQLGFHHLQLRWSTTCASSGAATWKWPAPTARALRQPRQRDDLWRELRSAAHGRAGRAPHPDFRHALHSPRPPHVQGRRGCERHPRSDDQPVQRHRPVQLQRHRRRRPSTTGRSIRSGSTPATA